MRPITPVQCSTDMANTDMLTKLGLRSGQLRADDFVHNGGWYNDRGEKLGWGDLSPSDVLRIVQSLEPGDAFYVLSEQDSFWNFVTALGPIGSLCATSPNVHAPGLPYVEEHARYLLLPNTIVYRTRRIYGDNDTTLRYLRERLSLDAHPSIMVRVEAYDVRDARD